VALLQRRLPGNVTGQLASVGVETIGYRLAAERNRADALRIGLLSDGDFQCGK
jgi:hypothetical protein